MLHPATVEPATLELLTQLMQVLMLAEMLTFFTAKYANSDSGYVVRSLTCFDDAESQADPVVLNGSSWPEVKQLVLQAVRELI